MSKSLLSEQAIVDAYRRGEKAVTVEKGAIVTSAATDRADQLGISITVKDLPPKLAVPEVGARIQSAKKEILAIGSDHGGFQLKELLKPFLENLGYVVTDLGTKSEESCDFPDFAYAVATMVAKGDAKRGIMIDTVGTASAIVANKLSGIRAACCFNEYSARSSREHNDANVLTLGGKILGPELAKTITQIWLETPYSGGRHQKRLDKITDLEKRSAK